MKSKVLFSVADSKFRTNHLLVIGILCIAFSVSFLLRIQPLEYGFELHEFDPFFNYRATSFLLENGFFEYLNWHDELSWHPIGRDVSATSQIMLHVTAAVTFLIFGGGLDLYDFVIVMPVVFGSLTVLIIFALVRVIGGTTAGLFASILFSMSLPIILRGGIGWFKSEPLGIFYGLLGIYLFLSGIKSTNKKITIIKMISGGVILGFGLGSWGGVQFFVLPIGVFLLVLSFLNNRYSIWSIPIFVSVFLLTIALFERPGPSFVFGLGGFSLIVPTIFFVACKMIQRRISNSTKICLVLLLGILVTSSSLIIINEEMQFLQLPNFRYLNAINPFLTTTNPLTDSVSEHSTTTIGASFFFHSILMIFAGLGIWILFGKKNKLDKEMMAFALIIGMAGVYVSSAFIRLEIFASISIIILSSIALSILVRELFKSLNSSNLKNRTIRNSFLTVIVFLLLVPLLMPHSANWLALTSAPPTIFNGGTTYDIKTNDWLESLEWIKNNTSKDSVVAAWWDYGYWISTLSQRATLADNSTLYSDQITMIAKMFLSTPDDAWNRLQEMDADYVVVFVSGERLPTPSGEHFYVLKGGGDESKLQWFMKIAKEPLLKYLYLDGVTTNNYFWNETLLGQLFPFSRVGYVDFESGLQTRYYLSGLVSVYVDDIKYPEDNFDEPFRLVYASSSYTEKKSGPVLGVFVYEINHDYLPN